MSSITSRLVTGTTTNLTRVSPSPALILEGVIGTNAAAYAIFVKFYWFDASLQAATQPVVGTTAPNLTIGIPAATTLPFYFGKDGLYNKGDLWVAVTKLVADTDTTVTVAGDGLITFMLG